MSATSETRYKPKGWTKYFVDGEIEFEIEESDPHVKIEYEEVSSLRACPDDTWSEIVKVESDDREIALEHCVDMEDFEPSGHRYVISVYNKLTKEYLAFQINEGDMRSV